MTDSQAVQINVDDIRPENMNCYKIIDSQKLRQDVIEDKIYPAYLKDLDDGLTWRRYWSIIASIFFTSTFVIMSASTILTFIAPQYPNEKYISYISGILGICSLMSDRFAHYCSGQSSNSTRKVNILLHSIGIDDTMPDLSIVSKSKSNKKNFVVIE